MQENVRCEPAPTEGRTLQLIRLRGLTAEQAVARLKQGDVRASDYDFVLDRDLGDGEIEVRLSEMASFGGEADMAVRAPADLFLLMLSTADEEAGSSHRLSLALVEGAADGAETIQLPDGCGLIDATAQISEAGVRFQELDGISWAALTQNAFGGLFDQKHDVQSVEIAHFEGMGVGDLEDNYLRLETLADQRWSIPVEAGSSIEGAELAGIDVSSGDGVWTLALLGELDMPLFLTVITD